MLLSEVERGKASDLPKPFVYCKLGSVVYKVYSLLAFCTELCFFTTHCSLRLIVLSGLDVSTLATRRLHACHHARAPSGGRARNVREFCLNAIFHVTFRDFSHAVKLRHGTDGFTSPPKEGVLRIFFALKIQRLRPGVNPRTCVPKASTLPLDHRSRLYRVK
jgi:hypothetical protein